MLKKFVPADVGDSGHVQILQDFATEIPKLERRLKKRGIPGVILDLEPHLKGGGQFGGFSGPDGMAVASAWPASRARLRRNRLPTYATSTTSKPTEVFSASQVSFAYLLPLKRLWGSLPSMPALSLPTFPRERQATTGLAA